MTERRKSCLDTRIYILDSNVSPLPEQTEDFRATDNGQEDQLETHHILPCTLKPFLGVLFTQVSALAYIQGTSVQTIAEYNEWRQS